MTTSPAPAPAVPTASPLEIPYRGRFAYSRAELVADGVVHAVGLVCAISAGSILLALAAFHTGPWEYVATACYVASLVTLLSVSFAYNLWPITPAKWIWRRLDHAAIYLLIAGTYTPFLAQLPDRREAAIMATVVWLAAGAGMLIKITLPGRFDRLAIVVYLALGWSVLAVGQSMVAALPTATLWLAASGGAVYSLGVIFFVMQQLKFQSAAWHGFVVVGAGLQMAALMNCLVIDRL